MNRSAEELLKSELLEARLREVEKTEALGMIHRLTELLPQKLGVQQTSEHLVQIIIEETDFENSSIALWDPDQKCLSFVAAFGLPELLEDDAHVAYHRKLQFMSSEDIAARVFATREAIFVEDTAVNPIPVKMSAVVHPACLICLPLLDLGVLNISASQPRRFTSQKKRNWTILGNIIAHLLLTASLNERLTDANKNLRYEVDEKARALELGNQELVATNRFLERVIDQSPEGICLLDSNGMVTRINESMRGFHGAHPSRILGHSPAVLFQDPNLFESLFERTACNGHGRLNDASLVDFSGRLYPVDVFLTKLSADEGKVIGYLLVVYNMTEKKALSEQLLRAEKLSALGTMAGGVGHDFNNMLMRVLGNAQLLLLQIDDEKTRGRLQNIEAAVQDAAEILRRLQTFADKEKEDHGSIEATDINQIVRDVIELTRPRWKASLEKHGHTVEIQLNLGAPCPALIHASDLREILTNLILNAVDAMPKGGRLALRSECHDGNVFVEVADSGLGMSEETRRKIFDPFFTTKGIGNSGLGLSVTWNLVNSYNGEIQVESQPGKGSTFRIRLPRAEVKREIPSACPTSSAPGSRSVLLVDDDPEILKLLQDMIRMEGHQVVAISDGKVALKHIQEKDFDLILTDMGMPGVSGWEIAKFAKERNPGTPVILITGWGTQYENEDLSTHGIDLVLSKPLGYEKLKGILQRIL